MISSADKSGGGGQKNDFWVMLNLKLSFLRDLFFKIQYVIMIPSAGSVHRL